MCWIGKELDEQVATKDITVYKVVILGNKDCASLFYKFNYKYNKLYATSFTIQAFASEFHISKGFHSYKNKTTAYEVGRHYWEHVAKCIIPKGSHYFINSYDEIVSDKIIIIG